MASQCYGIDLGDLNFRQCAMTYSQQVPSIVRNSLSNEKTPAVVCLPECSERIVGDDTKLFSAPRATVNRFGLALAGETESLAFRTTDDKKGIIVQLDDQEQTVAFVHVLAAALKTLLGYCRLSHPPTTTTASSSPSSPATTTPPNTTTTTDNEKKEQDQQQADGEEKKTEEEQQKQQQEGEEEAATKKQKTEQQEETTTETTTTTEEPTVVVSVPAHFTDQQRGSVFDACCIAGVPSSCIQIIGSPYANILYLQQTQYQDLEKPQTVAIVDVGHSQASVIIAKVEKLAINVLATQSIPTGANSIDKAMVQGCIEHLKSKNKADFSSKPKQLARIERDCRKTKETLSMLEKTQVQCECLIDDNGAEIDLFFDVTRSDLNRFAETLVTQLNDASQKAVSSAGISVDDIDRVEVIGGGGRIPIVRDTLEKVWGKSISQTLDGSMTSSQGASLYGVLRKTNDDTKRIVNSIVSKADAARTVSQTIHHVDIEPAVPVTTEGTMTQEELDKQIETEKALQARDDGYLALANARNCLEEFVFGMKDKLQTENMKKALPAEKLSSLSSALDDIETWWYQEDEKRSADDWTQKLNDIRKTIEEWYPEVGAQLQKEKEEREQRDKELAEAARKAQAEEKKEPRTDQERIKFATERKEQGNKLFKEQHYQECMTRYVQALGYLGEVYNQEDEELKKQKDELSVSCYLNIAAAAIKEGIFKKAVDNCKKVVEIKKDNAKAYFRMGQAHSGLQEYKEALVALKKAQELSPDDKLITKEINLVTKKQTAQKEKDNKMYAKMFGGV